MILNSNKLVKQKWDMVVQTSGEMKTDSLISLNTVREKMSATMTGGPALGDRRGLCRRKLIVIF